MYIEGQQSEVKEQKSTHIAENEPKEDLSRSVFGPLKLKVYPYSIKYPKSD